MAEDRNQFVGSTPAAAAETGGLTAATAPSPLVAVLERVGQVTHVWPALTALTRSLRTSMHLPDPRRGDRLACVADPLYRRIDDPVYGPGIAVPAGLEAAVRRLFESEGFAVRETGERPQALPEPDLAAAARFGPIDEIVLYLLRRCDRGVIAYDTGQVAPTGLVAQILLAYPGATFAISGNQTCRPLVLIDFVDRDHPELLRRSGARRDDDRRRGWSIDGRPAPTAVDRFIASRRGGSR